jgi:hypothetical protein
MKLNRTPFLQLLKSVNLGGLINECVVQFHPDGWAKIEAMDLTNCLFVSATIGEVSPDASKMTLGLPDLPTFIDLLSSMSEDQAISATIEEKKWMKLRLRGKGGCKLGLLDPSTLGTAVHSEDSIDKLMANVSHKAKIPNKARDVFLFWQGPMKNKGIIISANKKSIKLDGEESATNKMENVPFGKLESEFDFTGMFYGDHLVAILNSIDWSKDADDPHIHLGMMDDRPAPAVIIQGSRFWSLMPTASSRRSSIADAPPV